MERLQRLTWTEHGRLDTRKAPAGSMGIGQREFHPTKEWYAYVIRALNGQIRELEAKKNRLLAHESAWKKRKPLAEKTLKTCNKRIRACAGKIPEYRETALLLHAKALKAKWEMDELHVRVYIANKSRIARLEEEAGRKILDARRAIGQAEASFQKAKRRQERIAGYASEICSLGAKLREVKSELDRGARFGF